MKSTAAFNNSKIMSWGLLCKYGNVQCIHMPDSYPHHDDAISYIWRSLYIRNSSIQEQVLTGVKNEIEH